MATEKRLIDAYACPCIKCDRLGKCRPGICESFAEWWFASVDAVEVIRGEWRTKFLCGGFAEEWGYECSVCGLTVSDRSKLRFGKFATGNQKLNYCPNCGAKMDGDGNG